VVEKGGILKGINMSFHQLVMVSLLNASRSLTVDGQ